MATEAHTRNSRLKSGREKTIAEARKAIVVIEVVVEPIEVEVPLTVVPVEVRDIAVAIRIAPYM